MGKGFVRYLLALLMIVSTALSFYSCQDVPFYTADQVIYIAKNAYPCSSSSSHKEPSYIAEYSGGAIWKINIKCPDLLSGGNKIYYFHEDTGKISKQP